MMFRLFVDRTLLYIAEADDVVVYIFTFVSQSLAIVAYGYNIGCCRYDEYQQSYVHGKPPSPRFVLTVFVPSADGVNSFHFAEYTLTNPYIS